MRPFFTYYGGKYRAAPRYPAPTHGVIVEPFAGSAGYSLRHPDRDVLLMDSDPLIAETWRYLLSASERDVRALPLWGHGWTHTDELAGRLPVGAIHLIGFWLNKGMTAPCKTLTVWARNGFRPDSYWGAVIRERIATQLDGVRHWRFIEGDYSLAPDIEATWFVDPPYQYAGTRYRHGARDVDYARLADWCRARRGQVMVCENDGATWLPFQPFMAAKSQSAARTGQSAESLWTQ